MNVAEALLNVAEALLNGDVREGRDLSERAPRPLSEGREDAPSRGGFGGCGGRERVLGWNGWEAYSGRHNAVERRILSKCQHN